jgi:hypothetical protein
MRYQILVQFCPRVFTNRRQGETTFSWRLLLARESGPTRFRPHLQSQTSAQTSISGRLGEKIASMERSNARKSRKIQLANNGQSRQNIKEVSIIDITERKLFQE